MNTSRLLDLLIGVCKNANAEIKAIKANAFDQICAEIDRMAFATVATDELTPEDPPAVIEEQPAPPVTPEEQPAAPAVIEDAPAAPQPAEDPGPTIRRRGRPRKATIEEPAPSLLPAPAPEDPVEAAPTESAEPVVAPPAPDIAEDDVPW